MAPVHTTQRPLHLAKYRSRASVRLRSQLPHFQGEVLFIFSPTGRRVLGGRRGAWGSTLVCRPAKVRAAKTFG